MVKIRIHHIGQTPPPSALKALTKVSQIINFHDPSIFVSELFGGRKAEKLPELPKTTQTSSNQSKTKFFLKPVHL